MALVTLRIVDGPGRGLVYNQLPTPITIGREDGNSVQLNDERISRYHMKIHENEGTVLLTDLQSTNGTKVNGETVQLWILRPGDMVTIGRSIILVGTPDEISRRLADIRRSDKRESVSMGNITDELQILEREAYYDFSYEIRSGSSLALEKEIFADLSIDDIATLHLLNPPKLPGRLPPKQTAQLAELLQYLHLRLRYLIETVELEKDVEKVNLDAAQWQNLLDLYSRMAGYLHSITEP